MRTCALDAKHPLYEIINKQRGEQNPNRSASSTVSGFSCLWVNRSEFFLPAWPVTSRHLSSNQLSERAALTCSETSCRPTGCLQRSGRRPLQELLVGQTSPVLTLVLRVQNGANQRRRSLSERAASQPILTDYKLNRQAADAPQWRVASITRISLCCFGFFAWFIVIIIIFVLTFSIMLLLHK